MIKCDTYQPAARPGRVRHRIRRIARTLLAVAETLCKVLIGAICLLGPLLVALWEQAGKVQR